MVTSTPDPGGNFASDAHRRVMAQVANDDVARVPFELVVERVNADDHLDLSPEEVAEVLADLKADGDIDQTDEGYQETAMGFEALTGPIATDGGRKYE